MRTETWVVMEQRKSGGRNKDKDRGQEQRKGTETEIEGQRKKGER
tara:strand:- start:102 stop:236 length:135 start_codon:yes stop_codon:yes gene_type:complete